MVQKRVSQVTGPKIEVLVMQQRSGNVHSADSKQEYTNAVSLEMLLDANTS